MVGLSMTESLILTLLISSSLLLPQDLEALINEMPFILAEVAKIVLVVTCPMSTQFTIMSSSIKSPLRSSFSFCRNSRYRRGGEMRL